MAAAAAKKRTTKIMNAHLFIQIGSELCTIRKCAIDTYSLTVLRPKGEKVHKFTALDSNSNEIGSSSMNLQQKIK